MQTLISVRMNETQNEAGMENYLQTSKMTY